MRYRGMFWSRPAVWLVVACATPAALGQASQPATAPAGLPTIDYADAAFGFELKLPAGWEYDRSRFEYYQDSIGLLRARAPGGREAIQIVVFRVQPVRLPPAEEGGTPRLRMPSFEDWVVEFGKAVAEDAGAEQLTWETRAVPPRAAAVLSYSSKLGATLTRTHAFCVPFDAGTVWVLACSRAVSGPEDEQQMRRVFEQVIGTLRIHYDPAQEQQLAAAFERGQRLLERLRKDGADLPLDEAEYCYDLCVAGKTIGYLRRRVSREEYTFTKPEARHRYAERGLRVRERSWRFADDGTVRHTRLDLFSSFTGQNELIENQQTQIPAPDVQPQRLLTKTDQVVRKEELLFSSFVTSLDLALPGPSKPINVGPVYLDLAWLRVLPALLLDAPAEPHAFMVYDTETRALIAHTITPLGRRELAGQPRPVPAFEVREGLIDRPTLLYTDDHGSLLRLVAGDLIVRRITAEEAEREHGARRDAARQRFNLADD